jgi:hypothetical protein
VSAPPAAEPPSRAQWPGYAAAGLSALDAAAAVVQFFTSGSRANWWFVAGVGALIVALAGRWLKGTSGWRRPMALVALAVGVIALMLGLLAGSDVVFRSPVPSVAVTFPQPGDTVGTCERFRGTSVGIPAGQTLVLSVRDRTSGQPESYLWHIDDWDSGDRPNTWSGAIYFNTPDHIYEVRVYMVSLDEVKSDDADPRNQRIWYKPEIPSGWGYYLTKISVMGRRGPGTADCNAK